MNDSFWTNTIWYVGLASVSVLVLIAALIHSRQRGKTTAFWLAILAFTYFLEFGLLASHAYSYRPMIVSEPYFDEVLGNIFSQTSVSAAALLICSLGLSVWWISGIAAAYFLIDVLFIHVGVYEHFWYRSIFSLVGFFVYALLIRAWHLRIFSAPAPVLRLATVYLSAWGISVHVMGTLPKLLNLRVFRTGLIDYAPRDHTWSAFFYLSVLIAFMTALAAWHVPWKRKAFLLLFPLAAETVLIAIGAMHIRPGWQPFVAALDIAVSLGAVLVSTALLARPTNSCAHSAGYASLLK